MQKTAAKTYRDPAMNKLVQTKAAWNKQVSGFINDLIHLKKMMNGSPSKFFPERSSITKAIPADPAAIIGSLAGNFQDIAAKSSAIVQEQLDFATTRNKRKGQQTLDLLEKKHGPESPPPQGVDLANKINASEDYYLISEASNPLSRFWNQILSPGIGLDNEAARMRKYRVSLLNTSVALYKGLKKVQKHIVQSDPQSILLASNLLDKVETDYIFIASGLQSFKNVMPQGPEDDGGEIPPPDKGDNKTPAEAVKEQHEAKILAKCNEIVADLQSIINSPDFPSTPGLQKLVSLAQAFHAAPVDGKLKLADEMIAVYQDEVDRTSDHFGMPRQGSFRGIQTVLLQNSPSAHDKLQAVAQNILGKWKHQISPFDKTSAIRLDIYKLAGEARENVNTIMDELEKGLDAETLVPHISLVGRYLQLINTKMQLLKSTTRGVGYQPQFMNLLQNRQLSDYNIKLSPKEKEKLRTLMEARRLRDIEKMQRGK